ncbi:MAG TPA: DUF5671 domain-containing protein [bacterium]|nr:DUF5671 domain-containing protein [bacterium]HPT29913.1 DUF5671 domain-containing protein [bacterium]
MNQHNAKYAFYYLLSLLALIFMAVSVGIVSFQLINKYLVDALNASSSIVSSEALRFAISALLIAAPLFYVISSLIRRGIKKKELSLDSPVRRWLTYFILLVSSLVAIGALIALVNNFLSGEATWRSALKIISVLILGAIVFSFYFQEIRRKDAGALKLVVRIYFCASLAIVVAAFISAFFLVDSPRVARDKRLDQILTNNVYNLESYINTYYERNKRLPNDLAELQADKFFNISPGQLIDPETKTEIKYKKKGEKEFELCAQFRTDNRNNNGDQSSYPMSGSGYHSAGNYCFQGNLWADVKPGVK